MSSSQHKPLPQVPPSINKASQLPSTAEVFSADKVHDILCNQASWAQLSEDVIKLSNARKQPSVALFAAASPSLQGKASAPDTLYLYGGQQGHIQESQRANTQQQQRKPKPKLRLDEMDEAYREAVKSWIGSDDDGSDVSESDEEDQDEDDDIPEETAWLVQGGRAPDGSSLSAALLFDFASQSWSCLAPTNWASVPSTPAAAADLPQTARHVAAPYNGTVVIFTAATGALSFGDSRVPSSAGTLVCLWQSVQRLADPKGAPAHCPAPRMLYDVPTAQMANDAPRSVSCPAAVLSLYSTFFDDMFQDMVQDSDMDAVPVTIGGSQELSGLQLMLQCVFGARHTGHFDALQLIRLFRLAHQYDMRFIAAECVASLHVVTLTADVVAPMLQLTMDVGHCKELAGLQV
ncbi:hypothetical protein WJX72_007948 [[Myrmecia] bisecta]|uniref:BTB domain-containing protein n=1 Tax=[Myrmecia] bisecta TaxID=41462 RepID=A0AAW1PB33_9CHLO